MPASAIPLFGLYLVFGIIGNHLLYRWLEMHQPHGRRIRTFLDDEWSLWLFPWPLAIVPALLEKRLLELAA